MKGIKFWLVSIEVLNALSTVLLLFIPYIFEKVSVDHFSSILMGLFVSYNTVQITNTLALCFFGLSSDQGLILTFGLGTFLDGLGGPYVVPGIQPRLAIFK